MIEGLVNRILPFSSVDGPGNRTVIFLQGCSFNCLYCHNPETINRCSSCGDCVSICPAGALDKRGSTVNWNSRRCMDCDACLKACSFKSSPKAAFMTVEQVMKTIQKVRPFISGITVSGGECTLQKGFLMELFHEAHKLGLTAFADTNGSIDFSKEAELTAAMDMAMLDIKSYSEAEHMMLTGKSNDIVLKNAEFLAGENKLYEVRTVIVPDLLNNPSNVNEISRLISKLNPDIRYKLIKYRPIGVIGDMKDIPIPSEEVMAELKEIAACNGCNNVIIV